MTPLRRPTLANMSADNTSDNDVQHVSNPPLSEILDSDTDNKLPYVDTQSCVSRGEVEAVSRAGLLSDPDFAKRTLSELSAEAAALHKEGRYLEAVAAYDKVFKKAGLQNVGAASAAAFA